VKYLPLYRRGMAVVCSLCIVAMVQPNVALTQDAEPKHVDTDLTWRGITLYGTVDIGLQYETHGAPISPYYVGGTAPFVTKYDNHSVFGMTPSNLSQSKIGLQGIEPLIGDWSAVFKLESYFNPQSGEISDGLKALVQNNGRPLTAQSSGLDSSVAGQTFQASYVGVTSPTFGLITFGRQTTLLHDGVAKYDPQVGSLAFSLLGAQGLAAGGGDTQDRRMNSLLKYLKQVGCIEFGTEYGFSGANGSANTSYQVNLGANMGAGSLSAYYTEIRDATALSSLSASQVALLPGLRYSSSTSLAGTVSDNTSYALMGKYSFGAPKVFAGYEHIRYENPSTPLAAGFDIASYTVAFVNNNAYINDRNLRIIWAGLRYAASANLDLAAAYYGYRQASYASGAESGCSTAVNVGCSGSENVISLSADQHLNQRFDVYAGSMYSRVWDGLSSGYLHTSMIATTLGMRFKF
jgi:predicted porin